jgi:YD repeat-containing protein
MRVIVSFCMVALVFCFAACSKKSAAKPASQVSSISNSDGSNWNFAYDDQGRIATILYTSQSSTTTRTFQYGNKEIFLSTVDQAGTLTTDTLDLNPDGSISMDRGRQNNEVYTSIYTYSNGDLDYVKTSEVNNGVPSSYYSTDDYQNGDMISNSGGVTYTYYQNQPSVPFDDNTVFDYENYGNAAHVTKCAHMVQTYNTSYGTITFSYVYDSLKRVTQIDYQDAILTSTNINWQ